MLTLKLCRQSILFCCPLKRKKWTLLHFFSDYCRVASRHSYKFKKMPWHFYRVGAQIGDKVPGARAILRDFGVRTEFPAERFVSSNPTQKTSDRARQALSNDVFIHSIRSKSRELIEFERVLLKIHSLDDVTVQIWISSKNCSISAVCTATVQTMT